MEELILSEMWMKLHQISRRQIQEARTIQFKFNKMDRVGAEFYPKYAPEL
jgi:hypothetical protein